MRMDAADLKRTKDQTKAIVARLQRGPATNVELAKIALKYTSRVSDARKLGYTIQCKREKGGLTTYWLEVGPTATKQGGLGPLFTEGAGE